MHAGHERERERELERGVFSGGAIRGVARVERVRASLCWDSNTYSVECCDGDDYHSQGIGNITKYLFSLYTEEGEKFIQENNHKLYQ